MKHRKYRAWDKALKKMIYKFMIGSVGNPNNDLYTCHAIYCEERKEWVNSDTLDIMEYIQKKDKNNVEIYEGDIVKGPEMYYISTGADGRRKGTKVYTNVEEDATHNDIYVVEYRKELAGYYPFCEPAFGGYVYDYLDCKESKVMGNIYENSDLIKN